MDSGIVRHEFALGAGGGIGYTSFRFSGSPSTSSESDRSGAAFWLAWLGWGGAVSSQVPAHCGVGRVRGLAVGVDAYWGQGLVQLRFRLSLLRAGVLWFDISYFR
jgi:hypothetical protein